MFLKNKNINIILKKNNINILILGINFFLWLETFLNYKSNKERHKYCLFVKKNSKISNICFKTLLIKLLKINSGLLLNVESRFFIKSLSFSYINTKSTREVQIFFIHGFDNVKNLLINKKKNINNSYKRIKPTRMNVTRQTEIKKRKHYKFLYFSKKNSSLQIIKKSILNFGKINFYFYLNYQILKFIHFFWKISKKESKFKPFVRTLKLKVSYSNIIFYFKKKTYFLGKKRLCMPKKFITSP
jgi:hypothetical protein